MSFPEQTPIEGSGLCTLAEVKSRLGLAGTDKDDVISSLIAALTPVLNARYGREFMQSAASKRTFAVTNRHVSLRGFDLRAATLVRLHPEATAPTTLVANVDYALDPIGGDDLTGTYGAVLLAGTLDLNSTFAGAFGKAQLEVTGSWGVWATAGDVPADVNQAAVECVCSLVNRPSSVPAGMDSGAPRSGAPSIPVTWDIPFGAHRKLLPYSRNFGVW